jgi:Methylase involved in ubiquinone/menaquinone biosynthesis
MKIPENWTFKNPDIVAHFDAHVREQLPWYSLATGIVAHVARHYVPEGGTVIDIGASTGNIGRALSGTLEARRAKLLAIDNSEDMVMAYDGPGAALYGDARTFDFAAENPDLIVAFLVLMFLPVAERREVIERMKAAVRPGGAVVVFDKIEPRPGHLGAVIYRLTLAAKYEAGAPPEEIIRKELSLAGVQRPLVERELAGFEPVFRFGDFAGYVYERGVDG